MPIKWLKANFIFTDIYSSSRLERILFYSRPAILLEKWLQHRCFPVNFAKFLRTTVFIEHLWMLLLSLGGASNTLQNIYIKLFFVKMKSNQKSLFLKKNLKHKYLTGVWIRLPANIYLFKVTNRSTRKRCEICLQLTIKTPKRRQWRCSVGVFC